jgi:hypothetical protein
MADTAQCSTFSTRSNAKRAAEKMLTAGIAPAVDYHIKPRDDGRLEIKWKTNPVPATEVIEAELTAATEPATGDSGPAADDRTESEATETATAGSEPETTATTESAEPEPTEPVEDPFPVGTSVKVRQGKRKVIVGHVLQRIDPETWRVQQFGKPEGWSHLATAAQMSRSEEPASEAPKPERRSRRRSTATPAKPSRSQYAIDPEMIAAGQLPEKPPVVASKTNPHYQKRFDTLHGYAAAGNWEAVRDYKVTGSNSYSKMVARYRQDLLALHAASEAAQ